MSAAGWCDKSTYKPHTYLYLYLYYEEKGFICNYLISFLVEQRIYPFWAGAKHKKVLKNSVTAP